MTYDGTSRKREDLCSKYYCSCFQDLTDATRYIAFPMRCKSWDCPDCRKIKAIEYTGRMSALQKLPNLYFYTLTYYHSVTPDKAWKDYNVAWNRFRTAAAKKFGSFNYVRVLESHKKSPYPHLHIIADQHFNATWFNREVLNAGFGFQMDAKEITSAGAFHYIKKYLTKEWTNEEAKWLRKKYRCRIITFSRGLLSPIQRGKEWEQLLVGTTLDACIDHIRTDYEWRPGVRGIVSNEEDRGDSYECTILWSELKPLSALPCPDDWAPDDWVPK